MQTRRLSLSPQSKPELNVYESVEELIGHTPLVRLRQSLRNIPVGEWLKKHSDVRGHFTLKSTVYAKVESLNPGGSVKDRIALNILQRAEEKGLLKPGGLVIEATSGNTGAGLAILAAARGYRTMFVMPDKMSAEKVNALRAFGAKVVISPASAEPDSPLYYANVAKRLAQESPGAFLANQFFNPDNPEAHYLTTGPETWEQMEGDLDAFAAGIGTGGTLSGTARYLRKQNEKMHIVAVDPHGSIYSGLIREGKATPAGKYLVEGVGEDMVPGSMDLSMPTDVVTVHDNESFSATRMLAQHEGLLVGGSCGMAYFGLVQWLARHEAQGGKPLRAVVLLADSGSRYLSKVFNQTWLNQKNVSTVWGEVQLGGEVEYLPTSNKIEGV